MASRRFFDYDPFDYGYDPFGYYYTANPYDYYQRQPQPAPTRKARAAAKPAPKTKDTKTSFSIPVHGPDWDPEPEPMPKRERERERKAAPAMLAEEAAARRIQAAARRFLARKSVRAVSEVQQEAEQVSAKMASEAEALVADPRMRVAVGEALMRMLLRLDAVRGARDYRRRVIKRVLTLQDAVDALETKSPPVPAPVGEEAEADTAEAMAAVEMAEESAVASELPDVVQCGGEMESIRQIVVDTDTLTQVEEVDEAVAADEPEAEAGEEEKEAVPGDANGHVDDDEPEDSDAEGEWEMVTEEENEHAVPVTITSDDQEPPRKETACPLETTMTASAGAGAASDVVDARKVMEMMAALCEQCAKQSAVIGALVERVDALERTVRQMEDGETRRRLGS